MIGSGSPWFPYLPAFDIDSTVACRLVFRTGSSSGVPTKLPVLEVTVLMFVNAPCGSTLHVANVQLSATRIRTFLSTFSCPCRRCMGCIETHLLCCSAEFSYLVRRVYHVYHAAAAILEELLQQVRWIIYYLQLCHNVSLQLHRPARRSVLCYLF